MVIAPSSPADALPSHLGDATADETSLRRFLHGLPGVDPVGVEQRAAALATRSIKKASKLAAIDLAISMVDLTTLEGADTPGKVRNLARKAMLPDPDRPGHPAYRGGLRLSRHGRGGRGGARRAPGSRSPRWPPPSRPADPASRSSWPTPRIAVEAGADEIDMVIDRGAFLAGRYGEVFDQIVAVKAACGAARLKVILETGELATYDNVRRASWLALLAGGDFIKTSTGKVAPAATLPVTHVMLQAVQDWQAARPASSGRSSRPAGSGPPRTRSAIWSPCTRSPARSGWTRTTSGSAPPRC